MQGEKDWQKYETARRLKKCVDRIRNQYREDWKSKEMRIRQRAVALYFIDKVRGDTVNDKTQNNWGKITRNTGVYLTPFTLDRKPTSSLMGMGAKSGYPWCYLALKMKCTFLIILQSTRASFIPPGEILVYSRHNWINPDKNVTHKEHNCVVFPV